MSLLVYYVYLIIAWGIFRIIFDLPEVVEELWFKPVIWLVPLMVWNMAMGKKRVVFFEKKGLLLSLASGLMISCVYWLIFNLSGGINFYNWNNLGIALSVAVVEELTFSGFIFGFLKKMSGISPLKALLVTAGLASLSHAPFLLFEVSLSYLTILSSLLFVFGYSMINTSIRMVSGNVVGSIVARFILVFMAFGY